MAFFRMYKLPANALVLLLLSLWSTTAFSQNDPLWSKFSLVSGQSLYAIPLRKLGARQYIIATGKGIKTIEAIPSKIHPLNSEISEIINELDRWIAKQSQMNVKSNLERLNKAIDEYEKLPSFFNPIVI